MGILAEQLLVEHRRAPGDILVLTAAIRALVAARGGDPVGVATPFPALMHGNPDIADFDARKGGRHLHVDYADARQAANTSTRHFSKAFADAVGAAVGHELPFVDMRPRIVLGADDGPIRGLASGSYWVVLSGGKQDIPAKLWGYDRWQELVATTQGLCWVQAGSVAPGSLQRKLVGAHDMLGKTSLREFIRLIAHARGVACHVTAAMHAAAALGKPCVCVAGSREPWWWEAYTRETWVENCKTEPPADFVPHAYLHTCGKHACAGAGGCWRRFVCGARALSCTHVVGGVPACMASISVDRVRDAVLAYEAGRFPEEQPVPRLLGRAS